MYAGSLVKLIFSGIKNIVFSSAKFCTRNHTQGNTGTNTSHYSRHLLQYKMNFQSVSSAQTVISDWRRQELADGPCTISVILQSILIRSCRHWYPNHEMPVSRGSFKAGVRIINITYPYCFNLWVKGLLARAEDNVRR